MKITGNFLNFIIAFAMLSGNVLATTYYVSNSGNDANAGTGEASPWKTLSKVGTAAGTGDTILLKRGDIWREQLTIPANGMTIGAYGTGPNPIISGADVITGSWTKDAGEVYSIPVTGKTYQIFQDSKWVHLAHEPDTGYFTDDSYFETRFKMGEKGNDMTFTPSQITGATLTAIPAQWFRLVYKIDHYDAAVATIFLVDDGRGDTEDTYFDSDLFPNPNRYWLADKRIFLDSENEWYHDEGAGRLYFYQKGGGTPLGQFEVIRRTYGIYANSKDNLRIKDIAISKALYGIWLYNCLAFDIDGVEIQDIGTQRYTPGYESEQVSTGIYTFGDQDRTGEAGTIRNCRFNNVLRESIVGRDYDRVTVENNLITNSATIGEDVAFGPHGGSNAAIHPRFQTESKDWIIRGNTINHTGYVGIIGASGNLIENNRITYSMMYLGDGGAIYAGASSPIIVRNNYIDITGTGGYGNTKCGVYLDEANSDCEVAHNIIKNTQWCLFNHMGTNNHWNNNTCIDYTNYALYAVQKPEGVTIKSLEVKGNRFSTSKASGKHITLLNNVPGTAPHANWFTSPSDCDGNTFYPDGPNRFSERLYNQAEIFYDLAGWISATGLDSHSTIQGAVVCTPSWSCGAWTGWSTCVSGLQSRTRTCTDSNACSADRTETESQVCSGSTGSGLVADWRFDEGAGSAARDTAGTYHGAISGATWTAYGRNGSALIFDGADDLVDMGGAGRLTSNSAFTLMLWMKGKTVTAGEFPILAGTRGAGTGFWIEANQKNDKIYFITYNDSFNSVGFPISMAYDGSWHHIAGTFEGGSGGVQTIYLDGKLMGSTKGGFSSPTMNFYIGYNQADKDYFSGTIDEVRVYSKALTASEITIIAAQCGHEADHLPCDGCVTVNELGSYLSRWKNNEAGLTMPLVMEAIKEWKGGC